jgi:hypothetical protein
MVFQGPDYLSIFTKKKSKSYRILNFTFQPEIAQQAGEPMGVKGKVASVIGLWTDSQARIFSLCKYSRRRHGNVPSFAGLKVARDQFFHDFVGSAINPLHAGVGPHFRDGIFLHESIAAMELQTIIKHFALCVS